jgi:hypothetical protein
MPSRKNEVIYFSFGKKRKFSDSVLVYWGKPLNKIKQFFCKISKNMLQSQISREYSEDKNSEN